MSKIILSIVCLCATIISAMSEVPQISLKPVNCLSDGSGAPGICALSNIKRIDLEVTFDPRGNNALKSLGETALNPSGPVPSNYLVVRVVDNQSGASLSVKVGAHGAAQKDNKQLVYINLEILEEPTVRQAKIQAEINRAKVADLASGKASQQLVDKVTQQNAQMLEALDHYYVENRVGRFKLIVEYHSTQSGSWIGTVASPEVLVDVLNKGSGFTALQTP